MWNLDRDNEVAFITKPQDFSSQRTYYPTGFTPFLFKDDYRQMKDARFFSQNEDRSLTLTAQTKSQFSLMIRTFMGINLMDIIDIKDRLAQKKLVASVCTSTML